MTEGNRVPFFVVSEELNGSQWTQCIVYVFGTAGKVYLLILRWPLMYLGTFILLTTQLQFHLNNKNICQSVFM